MDIDKIARAANALKQEDYSHAELYKAMRDIQGGLTEKDLSAPAFYDNIERLFTLLYRHCDTPHAAKPRKPENWVRLAMPTSDPRKRLNFIYSEGSYIVASDGHRLHKYFTDKYPPGYYDGKMVFKHDSNWKEYFNIDRLIDMDRPLTCDASELVLTAADQNGTATMPLDVCLFNDEDLAGVNAQYLREAMFPFKSTTFAYRDKNTAIRFKEGDYDALVMPMRV